MVLQLLERDQKKPPKENAATKESEDKEGLGSISANKSKSL
ncbi:unnamed protein product [Larinioides sclopetarius]|uniref:Uncharacterized protein n=1 Tax=Larinioides sclopetarius TaxID=280406 RepID=A0AAV1ZJL5_9ARAC